MSLNFILLLLSAISCGTSTCPGDTGLRFGQTTADYIQLSAGIMDNSRSRFSVCTWIKKRFTGSQYPIVLHNYYNIILGDNGYYNDVAGTYLDLQSEYNRTLGTWFHVCMTWSNEDRRFRVYLDGHLIGTSVVTYRSELVRGTKTWLGNQVYGDKVDHYVFGGDLFKLNIYNRVLAEEEIKNMAADMCSSEEENLASITVLSWADILQYNRSGNVSDIATCNLKAQCKLKEAEKRLAESLNKSSYLEEKLDEVLGRLNNSEEELTESRYRTSNLEEKLAEVLGRLNNSEEELTESRYRTSNLERNLTDVLGKLNNSEEELTESRYRTSNLERNLTDVLGTLLRTEQKQEKSEIAIQQLKLKQG